MLVRSSDDGFDGRALYVMRQDFARWNWSEDEEGGVERGVLHTEFVISLMNPVVREMTVIGTAGFLTLYENRRSP